MLDLHPATDAVKDLLGGIRDDQLSRPSPCTEASLDDLIDHLDGLAMAFTAAAAKTPVDGGNRGPSADASRVGADWRERVPERLAALAVAWSDPAAWTGMTQAGGQDLPGEVAGIVALKEVVVHGWDVAVASGQGFTCPQDLVAAAAGFVRSSVSQNPQGTPGLFGPPVPVADEAPPLVRLIALTGRDPAWRTA